MKVRESGGLIRICVCLWPVAAFLEGLPPTHSGRWLHTALKASEQDTPLSGVSFGAEWVVSANRVF